MKFSYDHIGFQKLEGVEIPLSGKKFIVPPLNFKTIIEVSPWLADLGTMRKGAIPTKKQLWSIARLIHKALRRNYPLIRLSTVINGLDMANMSANLSLIMNGSGAASRGEAPADSQ